MGLHSLLMILSVSVLLSDVYGLRLTETRDRPALFDELQRIMNTTKGKFNTVEEDLVCMKVMRACVNKRRVLAKDCADLYKNGVKESGVYTIQLIDGLVTMEVYCDMVTDGGGWTVFQRRQDGSVNFFRGWRDYKLGFGNIKGEFWLGNDNIHRLTRQRSYKLRVDLEDNSNKKAYAVYSNFYVGSEKDKYKLAIGSYSGNAGNSLNYHNGQAFSTKDRDNDHWSKSCAVRWIGAWWYNACAHSSLNGQYGNKNGYKGVIWNTFRGFHKSLKRTNMMIRPVGYQPEK